MQWINATNLTQWGERRDAQNDLPELIIRLIYASCGLSVRLRFQPVTAFITLTAKLMVFKLITAAGKTWRKLKGENQLPKVIQGVRFSDGIEVSVSTS